MNKVNERLFTVEYQNKIYPKSKWYALTSAINFDDNKINLKYLANRPDLLYLRTNYLRNIKISTFWGIYFPSLTFLVTSLLISWYLFKVDRSANFLNDNQITFITFLNFLFIAFFLGFAYKIFGKRQKCIYTYARGQCYYKFITPNEIKNNISVFDTQIKNEYYYFAPLESERLIIRELSIIDVDDYYRLQRSKKVHKYLASYPIKTKKQAYKLIKQAQSDYQEKKIYRLAIELKEKQKVIGFIGLSKYDLTFETCQIVYGISEKYWHQGFTSEAVMIFVKYLKAQGKKLIIAGHVEENVNSGKVLLKNGFIRNPSLDHQMLIHKKMKNIKIYTIDERN